MRTVLLLVLFLAASLAHAQTTHDRVLDARRTLQAGADGGGVDSLLAARAALDLTVRLGGADALDAARWAVYYAALADYRLALGYWQSDPERAKRHTDAGLAALRGLARDRTASAEQQAEALALLSALVGNRIGLEPGLAVSLGPEVRASVDAAAALAPESPRVVLFDAVALQTTPPEWGGDARRAQERFAEAARLFERASDVGRADVGRADADDIRPQWGRDDVFGWMGMGHLMAGRPTEARPALEAGLAVNPRSAFILGMMPWLERLEASGTPPGDR